MSSTDSVRTALAALDLAEILFYYFNVPGLYKTHTTALKRQAWRIWLRAQTISAAQRCRRDVLEMIFGMLDKRDLCSVAVTCQGWSRIAYDSLYRRVEFSWGGSSAEIDHAFMLAQTLTKHAHVRRRIRDLALRSFDAQTVPVTPFEWLALLPPSVVSLDIQASGLHSSGIIETLLRAESLSSIRTLRCDCKYLESNHRLEALLARMPAMQNCSLSFSLNRFSVSNAPVISMNLERLHIQSGVFDDFLGPLLRATAPTLRALELVLFNDPEFTDDTEWLLDTILPPMPRLEQLLIHFRNPVLVPIIGTVDFSSNFPSLKQLYLNSHLDLSTLLYCLPRSLETLALGTFDWNSFPDQEFVSCLGDPRWAAVLRQVWFFVAQPTEAIRRACINRGIVLHTHAGISDLQTRAGEYGGASLMDRFRYDDVIY